MSQTTLSGTPGDDLISTNLPFGPPEWILGPDSPGGTQVLAGEGNDYVGGGGGSPNTCEGQDGDDVLFGGEDADTLRGGAGADFLDSGDFGPDELDGGPCDDLFFIVHFEVSAFGAQGADRFLLAALINRAGAPTLGASAFVSDFNPAEGDLIGFEGTARLFDEGLPIVFGGALPRRLALLPTGEALPVPFPEVRLARV